MNVPIISLEVQGMRHTMCVALSEHAALMDTQVQAAVEAYCTPDNIRFVISKAVTEALDAAVKEEIRSFFSYNRAGRLAVRAAVEEFLNEQYPKEGT